jgi:hypothetical protein
MAFACVLPGPSGDDSHPGVDQAIPTSVVMRRSQQRRCERHRGFALQIAAGAEARSARWRSLYVPWAPGQPRFRLMLVTLFRGDAVDEARRPDCWLVIEAEIDHAGPGPRVASRGDRMGRRLIFGSYRIDAAQQWSSSHVLAATCELDFNNICCELGGVGPTYRPRYIERL